MKIDECLFDPIEFEDLVFKIDLLSKELNFEYSFKQFNQINLKFSNKNYINISESLHQLLTESGYYLSYNHPYFLSINGSHIQKCRNVLTSIGENYLYFPILEKEFNPNKNITLHNIKIIKYERLYLCFENKISDLINHYKNLIIRKYEENKNIHLYRINKIDNWLVLKYILSANCLYS